MPEKKKPKWWEGLDPTTIHDGTDTSRLVASIKNMRIPVFHKTDDGKIEKWYFTLKTWTYATKVSLQDAAMEVDNGGNMKLHPSKYFLKGLEQMIVESPLGTGLSAVLQLPVDVGEQLEDYLPSPGEVEITKEE